ncbi:MAG: FimB/Mfa2 family fimbrial subunit [Bacteroidales bacterium]|nr:FimB/Mfa2 family fimbrial subunit [Bacteroidales bacterium]MCL2133703.1 FimB/Mfa2 family fimbrial subunit [Bacteroidales bacterium]
MNRRKILLLLLLPLLLPVGCIKEDYRNCPTGLYVTFEPKNPKHDYSELVVEVNLYFYDSDGNLKADFHYFRDELRPHDRAAFVPSIPIGDYSLVAVVNGHQDYETYGIENYATLCTKVRQDTVSNKLTDFFTSEKQISIGSRQGGGIQTEKMMLAKHNNEIRLKILYDGYIAPVNTVLEAYAEESSGLFFYSTYSSLATRHVRYQPWDILLGNQGLPLQFDISVFRLWIGSDANICLRETEVLTGIGTERFYTLNITDALITVKNSANEYLYNTNEKLEYTDEYEITMTLGKDFVILSLSINNWYIIGGGVEV